MVAKLVLVASLATNAAGASYAIYRGTREVSVTDNYGDGRRDLFSTLATGRARIVMFGDSLTDRGEWSELLGLEHVANRGIAGDTILRATARVEEVAALDPEVVIVMLGINDLLGGRSADDTAHAYHRLVAKLRAKLPRAAIVVQSVLPVRERDYLAEIAALNARLRAMCAGEACEYVDVASALADRDGRLEAALTHDGVHLTGAGYVKWARTLSEKLALAKSAAR
jgi:lysophospholipase L1-like esterase